jgi:paraquat-inducible protein B
VNTKVSPSIVGAFVIGAFALGILALLVFGGVSFVSNQRFVVYFDESIRGLNQGSPVTLRGVLVGRVRDTHVLYDAPNGKSIVAAVLEIKPDSIQDRAGRFVDLSDPKQLKILVNQGLRAQLGVTSLATGLLYVELDFLDPKENPPDVPPGESEYPVVPSVRSTISEFQSSASEILGKLGKVDFPGLSNDLKALIADARRQIDALDLKGLSDQWKKTGDSVDLLARSPEIPRALENIDGAATDVRTTLGSLRASLSNLDSNVGANGRDLQATLAQVQATLRDFDSAALTARRFVAAQQDLGDNANQALRSLSAAADAVQRLADFIERNPNALVAGKRSPSAP